MGFFGGFVRKLLGRGELEALLQEPVAAPRPTPVPAVRVRASDIERVATVPPPPPGAPPVDLRGGVDATHFSSSILIGLEAALEDLARELPSDQMAFVHYLRKTIANHSIRLPTIPEAVVNIEAILRKPECSIAAVAASIAADPAIATKLVGVANSPFYAGDRRITAIDAAIGRIGLRETKNVVQAIAFGSRMFRVPGWEAEAERIYHHALLSAMGARLIADKLALDADELFLAGLIHDIGRVVVLSIVAELEHSKRTPIPRPLVAHVADEVHADLSALVAESWHASVEMVTAARYHHRPSVVGPADAQRSAHVLATADGLARQLLDPSSNAVAGPPCHDSAAALQLSAHLVDIMAAVREQAAAFGIPLAAEPAAKQAV